MSFEVGNLMVWEHSLQYHCFSLL